MEIVTKCKTIEESWSRSTLVDCIKANLYQSSGNALTNFAEKLPAIQGKLAQEIGGHKAVTELGIPSGTIYTWLCGR